MQRNWQLENFWSISLTFCKLTTWSNSLSLSCFWWRKDEKYSFRYGDIVSASTLGLEKNTLCPFPLPFRTSLCISSWLIHSFILHYFLPIFVDCFCFIPLGCICSLALKPDLVSPGLHLHSAEWSLYSPLASINSMFLPQNLTPL